MKTEKAKMSEYLERLQLYQRLCQGIANVDVRVTSVQNEMQLTIIVCPLDESHKQSYTENGKLIFKAFDISEWLSEEENNKTIKTLKKYIDKLL